MMGDNGRVVNPRDLRILTSGAWIELGFNVIPYDGLRKRPLVAFRGRNYTLRYGYSPFDFREIMPQIARANGAYLLLSSGRQEDCHVLVVDLDFRGENADLRDEFLRKLPPTPMALHRGGKLKHLYYRTRFLASAYHYVSLWGSGTVDLIAASGVAIAGTQHKDGGVNEYCAWDGQRIQPTSRPDRGGVVASVQDLPLFDDFAPDLYERASQLHAEGRKFPRDTSAMAALRELTGPDKAVREAIWEDLILPKLSQQPTPRKARRAKVLKPKADRFSDLPERVKFGATMISRERYIEIVKSAESAGESQRFSGRVPSDLEVVTDGMQTCKIGELHHGARIHIPAILRDGSEDTTPSGTISHHNGEAYLHDWSSGRFWVLQAPEAAKPAKHSSGGGKKAEVPATFDRGYWRFRGPKSYPNENSIEDVAKSRSSKSDEIPEKIVPIMMDFSVAPGEYVSDKLGPIPDNTVRILVAPHGVGKTIYARTEHARFGTTLSVTNTKALTVSNAQALGLSVVEKKPCRRGSVCLPTLIRYKECTPPDFVHVDEADAVAGFFHSGIVKKTSNTWRLLHRLIAGSRRALLTSADMTYDHMLDYIGAIKRRCPTKNIEVIVANPRMDQKIKITTLNNARAHLHEAIMSGKKVFLGASAQKLPADIIEAYTSLSPEERQRYADTPIYERPVAMEGDGSSRRGFYLNGKNSRTEHAREALQDMDAVMESVDILAVSPAVQSGVSITTPVDTVVFLHTNRDVDAEAVIQMARRARNVKGEIVIGVPAWNPDPATLKMVDRNRLHRAARRKTKIQHGFVDYLTRKHQGLDVERSDIDNDFYSSWVTYMERKLLSKGDPIGRLYEVARAQGYQVEVDGVEDPGVESASTAMCETLSAARARREQRNAQDVSTAEDISQDERRRIDQAVLLRSGDYTKATKFDIRKFYGREATIQLVLKDKDGKYRTVTKRYSTTKRASSQDEITKELEPIMSRDARRMKDYIEGKSLVIEGILYRTMWDTITQGAEMPTVEGKDYRLDLIDASERLKPWLAKFWDTYVTMHPTAKRPETDHARRRWITNRLREIGAEIRRPSRCKGYAHLRHVSFAEVDAYAQHYDAELDREWEEEKAKDPKSAEARIREARKIAQAVYRGEYRKDRNRFEIPDGSGGPPGQRRRKRPLIPIASLPL